MSTKIENPFKPTNPQTKDHFIDSVKDETVKKYLQENVNTDFDDYPESGLFNDMPNFLHDSFNWNETPQGEEFWRQIYFHFADGEGTKTYADFKHLDESVAE